MTKKRGAPTKFFEVRDIIYQSIRNGDCQRVTCELAGITMQTYRNWIEKGKQQLTKDKEVDQEYFREFYLEIEKIKLENEKKLAEAEGETVEQRRLRRQRQAEKAFDQYLNGTATRTWTGQEFTTIYVGGEVKERIRDDGTVEQYVYGGMIKEIIHKTVTRHVQDPPAQWAIDRLIPNTNLIEYLQTGIDLGDIDPAVRDEIAILSDNQRKEIMGVVNRYRIAASKQESP